MPDIGPDIRGPPTPGKQAEVWRQRVQETGHQSGGETELGWTYYNNNSLYRTPWRLGERQILDK